MCFLMTCDVCRLESGGDCGPLVAEALFGVPGRALCRATTERWQHDDRGCGRRRPRTNRRHGRYRRCGLRSDGLLSGPAIGAQIGPIRDLDMDGVPKAVAAQMERAV